MDMRIFCTMALAPAMVMVAEAAQASATEWSTDFEAAKAKAGAEGKAVLLDFTGSDWCGCCNQLRKAVLDTPEFSEYAAGKFVCVEVDMPRRKKQAPELATQNKRLCEVYEARMFPTVLVVSPEGDVLGGFIGMRDSVARVSEPLDAAFAKLGGLRAARTAQGLDRAKGLAAIYNSLPPELKGAAKAYLGEIEGLDPENKTGFRVSGAQVPHRDFMLQVDAAGNDFPKVFALLDARIALDLEGEKPDLLRLKGMTQIVAAETEEDLLAAKRTLLEAAALMGEHSQRGMALRRYVERDFADTAALLARVKSRREGDRNDTVGSEADSYIAKLKAEGIDPEKALADLEKRLPEATGDEKAELLRLKAALLRHLTGDK